MGKSIQHLAFSIQGMKRRPAPLRSGFVIVLAVCSVVWASEDNSIFRQAHMEQQSLTGRSTHSSSEKGRGAPGRFASYQDGITVLEASWITVDVPRQRDYRVHDLVTIIVNEVSKSRTKSKSKLERENSIEAVLEDWIGLHDGRLRPDGQRGGDPMIGASIEKEFEGKGDTNREDMLTVRITAEIIDVLPNGNLVLEATKKVETDEDVTRVTLTGICRGSDIGADNTIISSKLARMEISKTHEGAARDATKRGFLHRFFDKYALF